MGTAFVVCYIAQIAIAIYALTAIPMKGELPTFYENARKNGLIIFGFLPCFTISIFIQIVAGIIYFSKVAAVRAGENRAQTKFQSSLGQTSGPSSSGTNPFGGSTSRPAPPTGTNPFASSSEAPGTQSPPSPTTNPFASGASGPAPSPNPAGNPFTSTASSSDDRRPTPFASGSSDEPSGPVDNPFA